MLRDGDKDGLWRLLKAGMRFVSLLPCNVLYLTLSQSRSHLRACPMAVLLHQASPRRWRGPIPPTGDDLREDGTAVSERIDDQGSVLLPGT